MDFFETDKEYRDIINLINRYILCAEKEITLKLILEKDGKSLISKLFMGSILYTLLLFIISMMNEPPNFFNIYRDELFFMAGVMIVFSFIKKRETNK